MAHQPALESVGIMLFEDCYRGRRVLITGHTGFKGSWLSLWLKQMGASVSGLALAPATMPNHWDLLQLKLPEHRLDIRNDADVLQVVQNTAPDIVFHLAAQPLVRRSYRAPLETWSTNVNGTANILEACRQTPSVRAIVVITTDKCYENQEWSWGYREIDRLGGHDPYSASKAAAEILIASYRNAFFCEKNAPLLASARAGNVIGGGDWSEDRLIPDLIRAISSNKSLEIRSPHATRPWQHVLESLSGYLTLGQALLQGKRDFADAWNFGPDQDGNRSVEAVLNALQSHWSALHWHIAEEKQPHEANLLYLDNSKAKSFLRWRPVWTFTQTIATTASWYRQFLLDGNTPSLLQIDDYVAAARTAGLPWAEQ
jgi:CDP-glucose 4,6-dehydratase